jgi:hypothetical protein
MRILYCEKIVKKLFSKYWAETENDCMFKRKKNVDCHGLRPLLNNRHLAEHTSVLLCITFNAFSMFELYVQKLYICTSLLTEY